ncbi:MAG: K+/H+ antiporter subunit F [Bacillota bacterium]|nr:K+/H+ antiporter subunit F [Bacillota bacterium]REJ37216.1 MAG: K+/H+ antiporter subunit F [Bacillota bacterium]
MMVAWAAAAAQAMIGLSLLLSAFRVLRGPTALDRTAAFDTFSANLVALIAVEAIRDLTTVHFDLAMMISLVPFVFSVVVAKFIVKGDIIDRDTN